MKFLLLFISLLFFSASTSGFLNSQLLTYEDIEFQRLDNAKGTVLASSDKNSWFWESYNQWQCFDVANLNYDCANYDYDTLVPSVRVETEVDVFFFDLHVEDHLDCPQTLNQWRNLIGEQQEVCIFAARMPEVEVGLSDQGKRQSLWYINRIKGVGGYWDPSKDRIN